VCPVEKMSGRVGGVALAEGGAYCVGGVIGGWLCAVGVVAGGVA